MPVSLASGSSSTTWAARVPWIDRLKVVVVAGVIVVHAATAYLLDVSWYYEERTTSEVTGYIAGFPFLTGGIFGLGPLFLVGGWLATSSLERRGTPGFIQSRLVRLGIPALVYLALIDPVTDWLGDGAEGKGEPLLTYLVDPLGSRDLGPVWFVVALLLFSLTYAAWRVAVHRRPTGTERVRAKPLVGFAAGIALADLVVWHWWGFFDRTLWNLNWAHWPQAAGLFALGVVAGERGWLVSLPRDFSRACGRITLVALATLFGLAGVSLAAGTFESLGKSLSLGTVLFVLLDGVTAVALGIWVVAWFERRWDAPPSPLMARLARGAYAAYLLHPPVLVALSAVARPIPVVPEFKFLLVAATGVPACYVVGYLVSRLPGLRHVV